MDLLNSPQIKALLSACLKPGEDLKVLKSVNSQTPDFSHTLNEMLMYGETFVPGVYCLYREYAEVSDNGRQLTDLKKKKLKALSYSTKRTISHYKHVTLTICSKIPVFTASHFSDQKTLTFGCLLMEFKFTEQQREGVEYKMEFTGSDLLKSGHTFKLASLMLEHASRLAQTLDQ